MTVRQDRMRMSLKLLLGAEEIGRAKAGADSLDLQRIHVGICLVKKRSRTIRKNAHTHLCFE